MTKRFIKISAQGLQHWKLALAMSLMCGAAAHAQSNRDSTIATASSVNIEAYGEVFAASKPVNTQLSKVFFYRPTSVLAPQPVNIYLDGHYHTSLLKGGFSELCTIPGSMAVQAILDDASRQHLGKQEPGQRLQFDPGKTLFLRLQESAYAPPSLQVVTASTAQVEMKNSRRQIHTVSRVKAMRECEDGVEVAAVAPMPAAVAPLAKAAPERKFALEADALFEFGKAELRASGYNAIEILAQKVKSEFKSVERIRIVGYTDAIGSQKINRKLSQDRAVSVAEQIRASGVHPSKGIQTEGRGSLELAKTDCANQPTPQNKKCHAPNRRVEVVVLGAHR